ncbi:related to ADAM protease ADM-B [Cephalotrichum gorgonifer]|uniref:Related to ADAM protease ADM-B n=1 Tax=Cephalotrichum gorgonifer TaxID=2041049 RepID=A0AAE8MWK3_9PEZI|nr:related to ADAM protease ADM-B [Cephalotrichum gorgonifer]
MVQRRQGIHMIEGAFSIDGVHYHIATNSNFRASQLSHDSVLPRIDSPHMLVWKESDAIDTSSIDRRSSTNDSLCLAENTHHYPRSFALGSGYQGADIPGQGLRDILRRQNGAFNPVDVIGSTAGCPSERLVAMIGVATDCTYTAEFDSVNDARNNIISQINVASQVYEDAFNISLAIRNLTISDPSCPSTPSSNRWNVPCSSSVDISDRLSLFSEWRTQYRDDNAAWSLLSTCGTGSTVGIARVGTVCGSGSRSDRAGSASTNVVVRTNAEWQVIAHELGHNFGANHDCTSSGCSGNTAVGDCCPLSASRCDAGEQFLMNPRSSRTMERFSPCTIGSICTLIGRDLINTSCLVSEADAADINDSQCGNGILEAGEACDCGGEEGCSENSCCNPSTCQLRSGAIRGVYLNYLNAWVFTGATVALGSLRG